MVFEAEAGVEGAAFEKEAFVERRLEGAIDRFLEALTVRNVMSSARHNKEMT